MNTKLYSVCCTAFLLIFSILAQSQTISTLAGNNTPGFSGDGLSALSAQLNFPKCPAIDGSGSVLIADTYNNRIRKVTSGIITTIAGLTAAGFSGDGGSATTAQFDHPNYVAVDGANNIYICDGGNQRIRKINTSGIITTVAGNGTAGYLGDGVAATATQINLPSAIAVDGAGNLYIADASNNRIRKVNTSGIISTIAGNGSSGAYTGEGGPATAATLGFPYGVAVDGAGNVYLSLYYDGRICKVSTAGIITTYAGIGGGTGGFGGDGGPATAATFDSPWGIATDVPGNLYIADNVNQRIRKVNTSGTIITIAGNGSSGYLGDSGPATAARMRDPVGVVVAADGSVYFAEYNNHIIRKVSGTLTHPPLFTGGHSQSMPVCQNTATPVNSQLAVSDIDAGQTETWSVVTAPLHGTLVTTYSTTSTGGTLTPTGLTYTPTTSYVGTDSFRVRVYDGTASDTTKVVVTVSACTNPPSFTWGHSQSISACINTLEPINSVLKVSDLDVGQPETWSIVMVPTHGTLVAAYSTTSTGSTLTPTGLSYTPTTGYTGPDSFKVRVTDGTASDTTSIHVTINVCLGVASVGTDKGLYIYPNPNNGVFTFSLSTQVEEDAQIVITNLVGEVVKEMTAPTNRPMQMQLNEPTGVYFINTSTAHGKWSAKITIAP